MLRKLRERTEGESGFTLIELLVVILILGILAAVAVPSFISQKDKGKAAASKSDVKSAQTAMESWYTDNDTYVGGTPAALVAIEPTLSNANGLATSGLAAGTYTVTVTGTTTGTPTYSIARSATGAITRTCSAATAPGCHAADANGNMW